MNDTLYRQGTQERELADIGHKLSVHHRNGNHWDDRKINATTLCASCHQTVIEIEYIPTKRQIRAAKQEAEMQEAMCEVAGI